MKVNMDRCKNCGLTQEMMDDVDRIAREEIKDRVTKLVSDIEQGVSEDEHGFVYLKVIKTLTTPLEDKE